MSDDFDWEQYEKDLTFPPLPAIPGATLLDTTPERLTWFLTRCSLLYPEADWPDLQIEDLILMAHEACKMADTWVGDFRGMLDHLSREAVAEGVDPMEAGVFTSAALMCFRPDLAEKLRIHVHKEYDEMLESGGSHVVDQITQEMKDKGLL